MHMLKYAYIEYIVYLLSIRIIKPYTSYVYMYFFWKVKKDKTYTTL